jgi:hypothetical protein
MRPALFSDTVPFIALLLLPLVIAALLWLCIGLPSSWMQGNGGSGENGLAIPDLYTQRWPARSSTQRHSTERKVEKKRTRFVVRSKG